MRAIVDINGVEGIFPGGICTANIPTAQRLHVAKIWASARSAANEPDPDLFADDVVEWVKWVVDGVVVRDVTAEFLLQLARLNGQQTSGEIPVYFSEPWRASVTGEEATAWDLATVRRCVLEMKLKSGIFTPSVKVKVARDFGRNITADGKPFLSIVKQQRQTYNTPAGVYDITGLSTLFPIQRIHFLPANGAQVQAVEIVRDGEKVFEASLAENQAFLRDYKFSPQSGPQYSVVFDHEQQVSSALIVNNNLQLKATLDAATQLTVFAETRAPGYI